MTTILEFPTATEIADAVRAGRWSAVDVVRTHLDRIGARDERLNAFADVRAAAALAEAAAIDARPDRADLPLAGVPVAIKSNFRVTGEQARHGSAATSAQRSRVDDEAVARLRAAGAVVVGTTRMPELAAWAFTTSKAYGPTRNPYDDQLEPGGSTGGGAVAVAAGMAALALGTDGGGSLRVPAAYCGVVGVKPTAGAVPLPGDASEHWCGLSVAGPIARNCADAALALSVLTGSALSVASPARLRVAVTLRSPSPLAKPDAGQKAAVDAAVAELRAAGHEVSTANPPYPPTLMQQWSRRWWAGIALDAESLGVDSSALERRTRTMVRKGRRVLRFGGPRASVGQQWAAKMQRWFADYDVLLSPVVARRPGPAGQFTDAGYLSTFLAAAKSATYAQAWNLAGLPAISVPMGLRDGLPIGVQIVGAPNSESLLLGVGDYLSAAQAG